MFSTFRNAALAAIVAGLALGSPARADIITLDVSGTMTPPFAGRGDCSPTCTLGGDIVIDNSAGTIVSADVTATGFLPSVGPWTRFFGVGLNAGLTELSSSDASDITLQLLFATPTAGSLVGYTGGPLDTRTNVSTIGLPPSVWTLTSGSLTPAAFVPEPASLTLLALGLAGLGMVLRTRRA